MKIPAGRAGRSLRHSYPLPPPHVEDWDSLTPEELVAYQQWDEAHGEVWRQLEKRLKKNLRLRKLMSTRS